MPRAFSSGALSIESNDRYTASPRNDSTFVIAAVSVVLPWSMCPIVPTFTCGFFRSNLFFAICWDYLLSRGQRLSSLGAGSLAGQFWLAQAPAAESESFRLGSAPLGHRCWRLLVVVELHRVARSTLGLSLIHISEPTRLGMISYAVFCLKKK